MPMIATINGRVQAAQPNSSSSTTTTRNNQIHQQQQQHPLNSLCTPSASSSSINGPLMRAANSLPHQLSQLCNTSHQQYPLLALQQNFSHLLPPNYAETAAAAAAAAAAVQQHQQQQQPHHHHHHLHHNHHQQQTQSHLQQHPSGSTGGSNQASSLSHRHHNQPDPRHLCASSSHHQRYHQQPYFHHHHNHHGFDSSQIGTASSSSSNTNAAGTSSSSANHEHNNNPSHLNLSRTHHNWRKSKPTTTNNNNSGAQRTNGSSGAIQQKRLSAIHEHHGSPHSLLDLSAKIVAEHIPFQSIEQRYEHIPEPVQRRIIFWSFPRHEDDIKMYSSLSSDTFNGNGPQSSSSSSINSTNTNSISNNATQSPSSNNNAFAWIDHHPAANANATQQQTSNQHISTTSSNSNKNNNSKLLTFHKGLRLYNDNCVQAVLQVGFNLSGMINIKSLSGNSTSPTNSKIRGNNNHSSNNNHHVNNHNNANNNNVDVQNNNIDMHANHTNQSSSSTNETNSSNDHHSKTYRVSVTFDRCKITSVSCSCELQDIFWCEHVVALILYRIRNPETIELRVPVSETLLSLDRHQLQKLVQYIIAEHHTEVLPTAQRLLDEMRQSNSKINQIHGAPDPTAGACADDEHIWHLDEYQVNEKVQNYLNQIYSNSKDAAKQINALFEKIREMFRAKDSNGTRLLKLITEQFLTYATRNEKPRPLWDQLVSLWVVVMLNPDLPKLDKNAFVHLLTSWSKVAKCPKEDVERRVSIKRKAADLSDDEDSDDFLSNPLCGEYSISSNQSNNYPAHMATHRHRAFQNSNSFPVLRPYNQLPILPSSCQCQLATQSIAKKMRSHHIQHNTESSNPTIKTYKPSSSSSHQPAPRDQSANMNESRSTGPQEPRSVFFRALDFQDFSWDDPHLQLILNKDGPADFDVSHKFNMFDYTGNSLWDEPLSQAAARVETLRSHGYREQALRLTVASVRFLKFQQDQWRPSPSSDSNSENPYLSRGGENYTEGWIGHPFDPINVLVDLLLDASLTEVKGSVGTSNTGLCTLNSTRCSCHYNQALADFTHRLLPDLASLTHRVDGFPMLNPLVNLAPRRASGSQSQSTSDKTVYYHVPVPGCCQKDSYLTLAIELALIALGQQRSIPTIATAHDRAVRQESELITKLESIDTSDPLLIEILEHQTAILLKGRWIPADSAPLHTYARYLFDSLVSHYPQLAYNVGIYALKLPLLLDENGEFNAARASTRSINHNHMQSEQLALAQTMLSKAKDETHQGKWLGKIYRASVKNIRNPASLLKLSKHVSKEAKPSSANLGYPALLKTSFDFAVQVLKMTMSPHISNGKTRKDAIQFIAECATDIGLEAVLQVMKNSREYFSATEALNLVIARESGESTSLAGNLRSQAITKLKLKEHQIKEIELNRRSRDLVLDCANRDPASCALEALKFCETEKESLARALKIIIDAGTNGTMDSTQLIRVADYIDERGMTDKAFDIAMVAVDSLSIPSNSDNSSSKKDITSACVYAQKVNGFSTLIPKLINNIECATVLSEIYHKFCPNTLPLGPSYRHYPNEVLTSYGKYNPHEMLQNLFVEDVRCWNALLKRTLKAFVDTTRTRLQNISPRHYEEFIDFLVRAQETFEKAADGPQQFKDLIFEIMKNYRTKKKLMERLKAKFDYSSKTSL